MREASSWTDYARYTVSIQKNRCPVFLSHLIYIPPPPAKLARGTKPSGDSMKRISLLLAGIGLVASLSSCGPAQENYVAPFGDWVCLSGNSSELSVSELSLNEDLTAGLRIRAAMETNVIIISFDGTWVWQAEDLYLSLTEPDVTVVFTKEGRDLLEAENEDPESLSEMIEEAYALEDVLSQDFTILEMRDELLVMTSRGTRFTCTR